MASYLDSRVSRILDSEVGRIVEEIVYIDRRLLELGDGEEDRAEKILLTILRRHLINDLREIAGFAEEYEMPRGGFEGEVARLLEEGGEVNA